MSEFLPDQLGVSVIKLSSDKQEKKQYLASWNGSNVSPFMSQCMLLRSLNGLLTC